MTLIACMSIAVGCMCQAFHLAVSAVMTLKVSKSISKRNYASVERLVVRDPLALVCLRMLCNGLGPGDALVVMSVAEFRRLAAGSPRLELFALRNPAWRRDPVFPPNE
ncbi:unnamed protein product [Polarella glacialis]|uniref:Uncharacterized protein n=1 Tax=Polarella glacialis TaxID=89957 RepID=A0A813GTD9_POLGL|nr:unnamed protein product [Polarella glacialis]